MNNLKILEENNIDYQKILKISVKCININKRTGI